VRLIHFGMREGVTPLGPPAPRIVVCDDTIRSLRRYRTHSMSQLETMFASRSVSRHLVRGALGLPMMVAAFVLVPWLGPLALLLVMPAAVLLRGCPTCWVLGLAQTCALSPRASAGESRPRR
jgi:hypothetical protein